MESIDEFLRSWYCEVDDAFRVLSTCDVTDDDAMKTVVVLMYDRTSTCTLVNQCRRVLYAVKNRAIENIPPTADALRQHCKRASHQTHSWKSCLHATTEPRNPCEWGWKFDEVNGVYTSVWSTIPDMSSHCSELIRCTCKTVCRNCKCRKNNLPCTKLCACDGVCDARSPSYLCCIMN